MMRYTLRLLTIQQFERATTLICAAEVLRRADPSTWGDLPFRIGRWVGARVTPDTNDQAEEWLKQRGRAQGPVIRGQSSVECPSPEARARTSRTRLMCCWQRT
ncbi:MAG: hypothetical protein ACRDTC_07665 [Pseudonocardiaceae bacterium]